MVAEPGGIRSHSQIPVREIGLNEILAAKGEDRKEAIFQSAAMIGGVVLARAVLDPKLPDEILRSIRQKLGLIAYL